MNVPPNTQRTVRPFAIGSSPVSGDRILRCPVSLRFAAIGTQKKNVDQLTRWGCLIDVEFVAGCCYYSEVR